MVAVQVVLMNYFLLGLHNGRHVTNDVILPDVLDTDCPYGCEQCSPVNGCVACKPPFFLLLQREGVRQTAICTRACPQGFYNLTRKKKRGFCAKCMLRGCRECSTRHYCSVCKNGLVGHAGRCRKRCPPGTHLSPRSPRLCISVSTTPTPDLEGNEIATANTTSSTQVETSRSAPDVNATSLLPPTLSEEKRKKFKEKRRERHKRRKNKKMRQRNRRRKERRRRRRRKYRKMRKRGRKKMTTTERTMNTTASTETTSLPPTTPPPPPTTTTTTTTPTTTTPTTTPPTTPPPTTTTTPTTTTPTTTPTTTTPPTTHHHHQQQLQQQQLQQQQ
ncbi:uncharacterized protein [Panulirus ornatus]|uniref:uncharacterized protein isoform X2 n=1 Tax=Panulirus ornatus TaxID=150431 RepID=UPI003A84DC3E